MVSQPINLILRGLEFFFTVVIIALVGNIIAAAFHGNPSVINYDMFVAVFAILSLIYLVVAAWNEGFSIHPALPLALDALNTLFFFCAAVAMAAELGVHSCSNRAYVERNKITNGGGGGRCREAQAATAFLWFAFAAFAASLFFSFLGARSGGVNLRSGGIRKGGPMMSQV